MAQEKLYPCPRCRNLVTAKTGHCWKCGTQLKFVPGAKKDIAPGPKEAAVPAVLVRRSEPAINSSSFGLASLMLTITLVAVCLALFAAAPGLGIIMAVCALPALIRTLMVVHQRKKSGKPISTEAKVGLYLGSFGVTLIVTVVTVIASVGASIVALIFSCFAVMAGAQGADSPESLVYIAVAFTAVFTIFVAGLVVFAFSLWIRRRWQHDIGQS
jgi:hypothetical protein